MNDYIISHEWVSLHEWYRMGWLRWVGCLKIQVSLQNTGLFCRVLLQKRPIFLSILLIVATPYHSWTSHVTNMTAIMEGPSIFIYCRLHMNLHTSRHQVPPWRSNIFDMNESCHTHERVTSHLWLARPCSSVYSGMSDMQESCHTFERDTSRDIYDYHDHVQKLRHARNHSINGWRRTSNRVMAHINGSGHIHGWVMSHVWMHIVDTHKWVTSHMQSSHGTYKWAQILVQCRTWLHLWMRFVDAYTHACVDTIRDWSAFMNGIYMYIYI